MDRLYHYSGTSGFAGIIAHSELWATDLRFLNDAQELKFAWDVFLSRMDERGRGQTNYSEAHRAALEAIRRMNAEDLDSMEMRTFATCLSELDDDVPQWRSYASDGHGVALGFDADRIRMIPVPFYMRSASGELEPWLATNTQEQVTWPATLAPVGYGDEAREQAVDLELWRIEQHCGANDVGPFGVKVWNAVQLLPVQMANLACVKHIGFQSEREWRLTMPEHHPSLSSSQMEAMSNLEGAPHLNFSSMPVIAVDVQFREGGSAMFKPYTAIKFPKDALVEVVLGPNVKPDLAEPVIRRLLDRHGFQHTQIRPSSMPYRT